MFKTIVASAVALAALAAVPAEARTDKIKVHGASLEGNLEGNSPDRDVYVFLPPSYDSSANKRYPVVYFLHGYSVGADAYDGLAKFQEAVDAAAAAGNEMIVVMPDVYTKFKGAMFGASVTTGDFERYVAQDLVGYVDGHYRTIADADSRGLSGHSMGGYGTLKIAMKYPGVFSSIYAMAPCCLSPSNMTAEQVQAVSALTPEQLATAQGFALATPATLSAWAPDPKNPPFYLSTGVKDGVVDPLLLARLHANSPLVLLPQYLPAMNALEAIRLEVGDKDFLLRDDTWMHEEFDRFGVKHEWQVFEGDHGNRVNARIRSDLLPFFGQHLDK
ncbi:prolyl oligopeptidase family serine peptidase [Croceibacterium sp. LX-88]|uniref:Prolyl oligopeptidase family serine peptidase n=1 Tax=Croceibacterium selenioxidans TaxID=2838833 RepID=A0ABS5W6Z2_9SPHN|nr:alpha/beta hydrolase [Croceibacterium selenioxidans]MBT2135512.1 prolyl oligopeptidase family serine peptidase [Croceibacterium selenioxidans]